MHGSSNHQDLQVFHPPFTWRPALIRENGKPGLDLDSRARFDDPSHNSVRSSAYKKTAGTHVLMMWDHWDATKSQTRDCPATFLAIRLTVETKSRGLTLSGSRVYSRYLSQIMGLYSSCYLPSPILTMFIGSPAAVISPVNHRGSNLIWMHTFLFK